jgi:hypothetical protein
MHFIDVIYLTRKLTQSLSRNATMKVTGFVSTLWRPCHYTLVTWTSHWHQYQNGGLARLWAEEHTDVIQYRILSAVSRHSYFYHRKSNIFLSGVYYNLLINLKITLWQRRVCFGFNGDNRWIIVTWHVKCVDML